MKNPPVLLLRLATLAGLLAAAASASAASPVDDSGTIVSPPMATLKWAAPNRPPSASATALFSVSMRLNVAPWVGRRIQVFMTLRSTGAVSMPLKARWPQRGEFLGGSIREGGRTLVFDGIPRSSLLEASVPIEVETDGTRIERMQSFRFDFETEVR